MFRNLSPEEWKRAYRHSERGLMTMEQAASIYAWHCRHHAAHITRLRERMGWR